MRQYPPQLIHGDCLEAMGKIPEQSVDLIFADPPYNIGVDYGDGKQADLLTKGQYMTLICTSIYRCASLLKPGGAMWMLLPEPHADMAGSWLTSCLGPRRNRIIWREKFGQYQEGKFPSGHRHLFYHVKGCTRPGSKPSDYYWDTGEIRVPSVRMRMGDKRAAGPRVPDDVWDVSRLQGTAKERRKWHPTQLRQEPLERIILCSSRPGDTVLDPFVGSGTTMFAAGKLDRRFIGIDHNIDYITRLLDEVPLSRS